MRGQKRRQYLGNVFPAGVTIFLEFVLAPLLDDTDRVGDGNDGLGDMRWEGRWFGGSRSAGAALLLHHGGDLRGGWFPRGDGLRTRIHCVLGHSFSRFGHVVVPHSLSCQVSLRTT